MPRALAARAQQPTIPLIGFLSSRSPKESALHVAACLEGLKAFGYIDGRSASVTYRWANGDYERLPTLANELVGLLIIVGDGCRVASMLLVIAADRVRQLLDLPREPADLGLNL